MPSPRPYSRLCPGFSSPRIMTHRVHTCTTWALATSPQLPSSWDTNGFHPHVTPWMQDWNPAQRFAARGHTAPSKAPGAAEPASGPGTANRAQSKPRTPSRTLVLQASPNRADARTLFPETRLLPTTQHAGAPGRGPAPALLVLHAWHGAWHTVGVPGALPADLTKPLGDKRRDLLFWNPLGRTWGLVLLETQGQGEGGLVLQVLGAKLVPCTPPSGSFRPIASDWLGGLCRYVYLMGSTVRENF